MKREYWVGVAVLFGFVTIFFVFWNFTLRDKIVSQQIGADGTGAIEVAFASDVAAKKADPLNKAPDEVYPLAPDDGKGKRAKDVYQNVQVLGNLSEDNFNRFMAQISQWVAPQQGCAYCHGESGNFASDALYTKRVARYMIRMTQTMNANWQKHIAPAGVNCYTCHRGYNQPKYFWFTDYSTTRTEGMLGWRNGQNTPGIIDASLPTDPFTKFLLEDNNIRVETMTGPHPLPHEKAWIKDAEWTYSLMNHISTSLGVNCDYCHNTRAFGDWTQSPPVRAKAWWAIRMVRMANQKFMEPLRSIWPANMLGPEGDGPKVYCLTCHQGIAKPLYGADMVTKYPSLQAIGPQSWPPVETAKLMAQ